jgi:type II secretory pathway predicted ATPase ExeA
MALEKSGYERYGLTGNPFRDLTSDSIDDVEIFHVKQQIDNELDELMEEVEAKENKAVVMLLASLGAGKTERLMLIMKHSKEANMLCVLNNITPDTKYVIKNIASSLLEATKKTKKKGMFPPKWKSVLQKTAKKADKDYDPEAVGKAIAEALNDNAPSYLLLNDMHGFNDTMDLDNFMMTLHITFDSINPGVMIVLTSSSEFFTSVVTKFESFNARINRKILVQPLNDSEAGLMIAKRLLAKRIVVDMQPLYPFTEESIKVMNSSANGNPRVLLKMADVVIDFAAKKKAIQISEEIASQALESVPIQAE